MLQVGQIYSHNHIRVVINTVGFITHIRTHYPTTPTRGITTVFLYGRYWFYKDTNYLRTILRYWWFIVKFDIMAKAIKKTAPKKSAKEASNIFHNIMQASVANNPKPKKKEDKKK